MLFFMIMIFLLGLNLILTMILECDVCFRSSSSFHEMFYEKRLYSLILGQIILDLLFPLFNK